MDIDNNYKVNKNEKVSKGYRLKVSTHNKIKELQSIINESQETVISRAIRLYLKKLMNKKVHKQKTK